MRAGTILAGVACAAAALFAIGCSPVAFERFSASADSAGGLVLLEVPHVRQIDGPWCGPACLDMVGQYWQTPIAQRAVGERYEVEADNRGMTIVELRDVARQAGMHAFAFEGTIERLAAEIDSGRPAIVAVDLTRRSPAHPLTLAAPSFKHFMVVTGYHPQRRFLVFNDPMQGPVKASYDNFLRQWSLCERAMLALAPRGDAEAAAQDAGSEPAR